VSEAASVADIFYDSLGHHVEDDVSGDLRKLSEGLSLPLQQMYDLVRPRLDQDGWAILLDPDECPAYALPWLAYWVGVTVTPEMTEEQIRNEIRQPTGWKRGQEDSIRIAAQRTLTGTREVIIHARTPEPGYHYIRTFLSETPDPERTEAVLRAALPAWQVLHYRAISDVSWEDINSNWTWAELETDFKDWADVEDTLPSELPE
jgi:hypothetical protein